jgi:hypothetical protein
LLRSFEVDEGLEFVEDVVDFGRWEMCGFSFAEGVKLASPIGLESVEKDDAVVCG